MIHKRKSCPVYGHENLSMHCTCNQPVDLEHKLEFISEFKVFRIMGWDYRSMDWSEKPGTMNNGIAAYSHLRSIQEAYARSKGSSGDRAADKIRNTPWDNWSDLKTPVALSEDAIVFLRKELDAKTDGTEPQDKEWREYNPNAAWRLSPDGVRVEEISQFFGTQIADKWLNGYEKYGTKFLGDPVEHAFLEARDHMVYLWYIRAEREELRTIIENQVEEIAYMRNMEQISSDTIEILRNRLAKLQPQEG